MPRPPRQFFLLANLIWWLGLPCLIAVDYFLRLCSSNYFALGMSETLWFGLQLLLAACALVLLGLYARDSPRKLAALKIGRALLLSAVYHVGAVLLYVVGTGIDAF